ncbi:MAG: 4-(cytidine 5'-diphospho)-2-C-methyl-D-erythritol kinase, partial [Clostridia bacterium]|nr:4-(cytidine 5'-diphospho)-2-C-methyl-D-erythritol kinase [Clostridia bacterium]
AFEINPEVHRVYDEMKKLTPCTLMSGSGSAVFGIFESEESAVIAKEKLVDLAEFVEVCKTTPIGVSLE